MLLMAQFSKKLKSRVLRREIARRNAVRGAGNKSGNYAPQSNTAMSEILTDRPSLSDANGVVYGVYGMDDWTTNTYLRDRIVAGQSTVCVEATWILPATWDLHTWIVSKTQRYNFTSKDRALVFFEWGIGEVTKIRNKLLVELNGFPKESAAFFATIDLELKRAENLIEWVYGCHGDSISVPLNYRPAIHSAYPWLPTDIDTYIDGYMDSDASVLILIGPPGTGKTTFIKNLIHRSGADAKVTYDEKIMNSDSLFANFIEGNEKFLIMEDADAFLQTRTSGNTMMHRFLNVSDGLISAKDKKLVFSTNLPSIRDIDEALMRPGRCYDVVEFRALTRPEAANVASELGLELPDGAEFTLAELFNEQPSAGTTSNRQLGFY